jgi:hypothetical protein
MRGMQADIGSSRSTSERVRTSRVDLLARGRTGKGRTLKVRVPVGGVNTAAGTNEGRH